MVIDKELKTDLDELKSLLAHQSPKLTYLELIRLMVKKTRRTLGFKTSNKVVLNQEASVGNPISQDICAVAEDWTKSDVASETLKHSRYINSQIKRQIWLRDNGCCQFVGKKTGRKCNSRYFIEIDHIHRFADGGSSDISNLRLICRNHNQFRG